MMWLQHPFSVSATLERSVVLTYAVDPDQAAARLPAPLQLDLYQGHAFCAAALAQTRGLRPSSLHSFFGRDFVLAGYRLFVKHTRGHRTRRGLYILRSETNSRWMRVLGDLLTAYRYRHVDIEFQDQRITSLQTGLEIRYEANGEASLPEESPFPDWDQARAYAGPMPYTFSVHGRTVLSVRGHRSAWSPRPLQVHHAQIPFLRESGFERAKLANAFIVDNVPYRWDRGVREPWD
ncbi:MAG: DUF2071 domain-containing protein [Myxococcota bacterium]